MERHDNNAASLKAAATVAPQRRSTGGRVSEWAQPRAYLVSRDTRVALPAGFDFAGPAILVALTARRASVTLNGDAWGDQVAAVLRRVLVVPSIATEALIEPGGGSRSYPDLKKLKVRKAAGWPFERGDRLTLCAVSARVGEVAVVPLLKLPG